MMQDTSKLSTDRPPTGGIKARNLSPTQGLVTWNMMRGGMSPEVHLLLNVPPPGQLGHVEQALPAVKQSHRHVCQFLRDLADSIDPEGPLLQRYSRQSKENQE